MLIVPLSIDLCHHHTRQFTGVPHRFRIFCNISPRFLPMCKQRLHIPQYCFSFPFSIIGLLRGARGFRIRTFSSLFCSWGRLGDKVLAHWVQLLLQALLTSQCSLLSSTLLPDMHMPHVGPRGQDLTWWSQMSGRIKAQHLRAPGFSGKGLGTWSRPRTQTFT